MIRLRRPWNKSLIDGSGLRRIDVPELERLDEACTAGKTYQYQRSFNQPSGMCASTRVELRIEGWKGDLVSITVNGHPLNHDGNRVAQDVTTLLECHNRIVLELTGSAERPARLSGAVTLVIVDAEQ